MIVTISLALEAVFYSLRDDVYMSLVGLLVLVRIWRFVRIGHGIVEVTNELVMKKYHKVVHHQEILEALLRENGIDVPNMK